MTVDKFYELLNNKILVLDGATGTELQKRGMPNGVCPEKWICDNPQIIKEVQSLYKKSGSDVVYTPTFGGTRLKLDEFGFGEKVYDINKKLALLSREIMGNDGYVAGDIAPTGKFVEPFGELKFEDAVNVFKEQAKALYDGGVDFFIIETMLDIQETRAAVIAVKEICDLPVVASMTFTEDERTLTGTDPITAVITLQSLGVHAVGCNCSVGPDSMVKVIKKIKPYAKIPLIAKPNAGLPKLIEGKTVFNMSADEFASFIPQFVDAGVNMIGGCCGTSFEFIKKIKEIVIDKKPQMPVIKSISAISSARGNVLPGFNKPVCIIGERINPTGKKKLQEELRENKYNEVKRFAMEQTQNGADILDVNVGTSGINEKEVMIEAVKLLSTTTNLPLAIDSSNPDVIEAALRIYPGRALINSISKEEKKYSRLMEIVKKYGAMFIFLPLDDKGVPKTALERIKIINEFYTDADKYGFTKNDFTVDGIVMTVSSDQNAAKETLKLIKWCSEEFKVNTVVGLSNVSFGLPERKYINAGFLSMAIANGLTMAIANPNEELLMNMKFSSDVLVCNDVNSKNYIGHFGDSASIKKSETKKTVRKPEELVYDGILNGDKDNIVGFIKDAIAAGIEINKIVDDYLIKAINDVGDLYEKKIYFLPQLISSAEAMKTAFNYLEPILFKNGDKVNKNPHKIILATVKGDIHDIGKNIVGLMLKNYGYTIIDLGKDVESSLIIDKAINENADIIGLSALMTTTMTEMKKVINLARDKKVKSKIIIGGAVINEQYAKEIKADGYARDGFEAVKLVQQLLNVSIDTKK